MIFKITNIGLAIGTTVAAFGIAITAIPDAKAGGLYWNNNGGGAIVVNRSYFYGPRGYYTYGPRYHRRRGFIAAPNGVCARGYYGRVRCLRY